MAKSTAGQAVAALSVVLPITLMSVFASPAMAQVNIGGSYSGNLTCNANVFNPSILRAGGYAERLGDIVIECTGGAARVAGSAVPTWDITVTLNNTQVSSHVFGNGLSEALLMIDEPGSIQTSPTTATLLPQTLCSGGALGAGAEGCTTFANPIADGSLASTCAAFTNGVCTSFGATPNVFQGVVNANQVVFHGIPILPPVSAGLARVFRIMNLRADSNPLLDNPPLSGQIPLLADVTIAGFSNWLVTLGNLFHALGQTSVRTADNSGPGTGINVLQCAPNGLTAGAVLRFPEGIASSFKTRIMPTEALSGAATPPNSRVVAASFTQNLPAAFSPGSESGFIVPVNGGAAGLADFGSRLKATFTHVPAGVSVYVSTTNINPLGSGNISIAAGTNLTALANAVASGNFGAVTGSVSLLAGLVSGEDASPEGGSALPLVAGTLNSGGVNLYGPLPVDANGTATAVWEILLADQTNLETADFAVFYTSNGNAATNTPSATVALSFAPTFSTLTASGLRPRFQPVATASPIISVAACQGVGVSLVSSINPSVFGQPLSLGATVSANPPGAGTPTGAITFRDGAVTLGTVMLSSGSAVLTTAALNAGGHSVTAAYNGDSHFPGATSAAIFQIVNKAVTITNVNLGASSVVAGSGVTITTNVVAPMGTPSGVVTFRDGGAVLGSTSLSGGSASLTGVVLSIGSHTITVLYSGDANFLSSISSGQIISVLSNETHVSTPVLRSGAPAAGQALTFAATVTGTGRSLTGFLTFLDNGVSFGSALLDASGTGAITTTSLSVGAHLITAVYGGDPNNGGSTSPALSLTVRGTPTVVLSSSSNPSAAGGALTLQATVSASPAGSAAPTGSVTFTDGAVTLGTVALSSGQAALSLSSGLTPGDHSIVAVYSGDGIYAAASSAALTQSVSRAVSSTTLSQGVDAAGYSLTAAAASSISGTPTGSAQFTDVTAGTSLGSATFSSGAATLILKGSLPVGHALQAVYSGDAIFAGSASAPQVFIAAGNSFSFVANFVPDSLSTIMGADLAGSTASAPDLPLPKTLGDVAVKIVDGDGRSYTAPLYYVSPTQINFVIPAEVPDGLAKLAMTSSTCSHTVGIRITHIAPALASADGSGAGLAAAQVIRVHADGTQEPPVPVSSSPIRFGTSGDRLFLALYGTGLRHAAGPVSCALNGQAVPALFSGAAGTYPGLDQINLELPGTISGEISLTCSADGMVSNAVTATVQ